MNFRPRRRRGGGTCSFAASCGLIFKLCLDFGERNIAERYSYCILSKRRAAAAGIGVSSELYAHIGSARYCYSYFLGNICFKFYCLSAHGYLSGKRRSNCKFKRVIGSRNKPRILIE